MVNMTAAVISTGMRVDTKPEAELDAFGSARPFPTLGSLF